MSRHQRFYAALLMVAGSVALGACGSDPTGVRPVVGTPLAPVQPLGQCTNGDVPAMHSEAIVEAIRGASAARAAQPEKVVSCVNAQ